MVRDDNALDAWRRARGWSYAELGDALGVSSETARRYCIGSRVPRPPIMAKIRRLTQGAVTADSFTPDPGDELL